jgi:hypothetical protein
MSEMARAAGAGDGHAGAQPSPGVVPARQRCVWPGCTRQRATGRAAGSGRQKEYCLQADPPEAGGGPVHNARNRWAALRGAAHRAAQELAGSDSDEGAGQQETAMGGGEQAATVHDQFLYSAAKKRASDLLEQARRQHAAAVAGLRAERELYQRLGEQLAALTDPASLDLEIAAIASRAGASVAQAEEDAARARRAQLAAERERDDAIRLRGDADAAAEQLAGDAEAAETALAERTAAFDRDRATLLERARDAEKRADRARAEAAAAKAAAEREAADALRSVSEAREQATAEIGHAPARAGEAIARARRAAEEAADRAREQVAAAEARADAQADRARREVDAARRETAAAREAAADTAAKAATAGARADASAAEAERARAEIGRQRAEMRRLEAAREAEVGRLTAAHQAALDAERARATRAETELDALRGTPS